MSGRPRKAPNTLAGHRPQRQGTALSTVGERLPAPELPKWAQDARRGWLAVTKERWDRFWDAPITDGVVLERRGDMMAVERYFVLLDELERAWRGYREKRVLANGRVNPLFKVAMEIEGRMMQMDQKLGLTPMDRLRMGISFGEAAKGFDDMMSRAMGNSDEEDEEDAPPSLAALAKMKVVN